MLVSTEVFVMAIFIAGCPFFFIMLRDSEIPGRRFFLCSYLLLTFSNIFTVVENFGFHAFFNVGEHLFITLGAITFLIALVQLTTPAKPRNIPPGSDG